MLLKVVGEFPEIVLFEVPLKLIVPLLALKVPLFVQFPYTSRFRKPSIDNAPFALMIIFPQATFGFVMVTDAPLEIVTSSLTPGTFPVIHVAGSFQSPPLLVDMMTPNGD
jgi:hypothetical protein